MMSMTELFYGESEPAYFGLHSERQSGSQHPELPSVSSRRVTEFVTFNLMVPMCCQNCEDEVRDALLALGSVTNVVCDPYNQRVTISGYLDPAQAIQQLNRVMKNGAATYSSSDHHTPYRTHQYTAAPSHQKPQSYLLQKLLLDNKREEEEKEVTSLHQAHRDSNRSRYFSTSCPGGYRESAITHVVSANPAIATRVEMAY